MSVEIAEFFTAMGIPIYEGYGLTETSPVIALNGPGAHRLGTVGRPLRNLQIRVAEDGEILVRGPNVMKGYYGAPRETGEVLQGGWFRTGDIGTLDAGGYLVITDRKKDLIVTSGGKNVAPQPIENRLKRIRCVDNAVLLGEGHNFIAALIVPNYEALTEFARTHRIAFQEPSDLIHKPEIYNFVMGEIARATRDLSDFEKIRKIALLDQPFTIDGGELTPTMKLRRAAIEHKNKAAIEKLYSGQ